MTCYKIDCEHYPNYTMIKGSYIHSEPCNTCCHYMRLKDNYIPKKERERDIAKFKQRCSGV